MKLLVLTPYCSPEHAASSYLGANRNEAFIAHGFDILVYTPTPCRGIDNETIKEYTKVKHRREFYLDGHREVRRFLMFRERRNVFQRTIRYFLIACCHFYYGLKNDARNCDVMFIASTPPFQGALASLIKLFTHQPLIYNLQDVFPDSLVSTGLTRKGSFLWKVGRAIENFTYRHADKIIVISEDFKRNIMAKGVPEEKIEVIYNWVDEQAVKEVKREDNVLFDRYGLDRAKFYVTYCGNIGLTQNMDMLLEVAKALEANDDIHFVLVGNGAYKEQLEKNIRDKRIRNVTLLPFQPYEEISHVFSLGDVGLVISKPGVGENSVPSKTWSIMSASRPVLASFDENELKTIIENHRCGIFTKSGDKVALCDAIISLYCDRELSKAYGKNGRQFIMDNLTKEAGTAKYVKVIRDVVSSHGKGDDTEKHNGLRL